MQNLDAAFLASLRASRDAGIAPVYFFFVRAKNRSTGVEETMGLWSGDEDIVQNVQAPDGGVVSRTYLGGCNLRVSDIVYVADLTDEPVTVSMSQISPATQQLVRGYDVRMAYCEIHATSWVGGVFASVPQLQWIGVIDAAPISTPEAGGDGGISLTVRSELMAQLTAINPPSRRTVTRSVVRRVIGSASIPGLCMRVPCNGITESNEYGNEHNTICNRPKIRDADGDGFGCKARRCHIG